MLYICVYLVIGAQSRTNKLRTNKKRAAAQHGFTSNAQWQWPTNDWFETICKLIALAFSILLLLCVNVCVYDWWCYHFEPGYGMYAVCSRTKYMEIFFDRCERARASCFSLDEWDFCEFIHLASHTKSRSFRIYMYISSNASPLLATFTYRDFFRYLIETNRLRWVFFLCSSRAFWLLRSVAWFCFSFAIRVNSIKFLVVRNWACALNNK